MKSTLALVAVALLVAVATSAPQTQVSRTPKKLHERFFVLASAFVWVYMPIR